MLICINLYRNSNGAYPTFYKGALQVKLRIILSTLERANALILLLIVFIVKRVNLG